MGGTFCVVFPSPSLQHLNTLCRLRARRSENRAPNVGNWTALYDTVHQTLTANFQHPTKRTKPLRRCRAPARMLGLDRPPVASFCLPPHPAHTMNDDARHRPPKEGTDRPASALTFVKDTKASQDGERVAPRTRRPSASQPNNGEGFSTLLPIRSNEIGVMEGVLAMREDEDEKEGSSAEGKEGSLEPEWTYPDGGLRAWLVVFVSTF